MIRRVAYFLPLLGALVVLVAFLCRGGERYFGQPIGEGKPVSVSDVVLNVEAYLDKSLVLRGRIGAMCQTAGCWFFLADEKDQLYVSLQTFSLPRDVAGNPCRVAGKLVMRNERPTLLATGVEFP